MIGCHCLVLIAWGDIFNFGLSQSFIGRTSPLKWLMHSEIQCANPKPLESKYNGQRKWTSQRHDRRGTPRWTVPGLKRSTQKTMVDHWVSEDSTDVTLSLQTSLYRPHRVPKSANTMVNGSMPANARLSAVSTKDHAMDFWIYDDGEGSSMNFYGFLASLVPYP